MSPNETDWKNLGTRRLAPVRLANFPNADDIVAAGQVAGRSPEAVDILLVNPPTPDGGLWIRTQHRVGRRQMESGRCRCLLRQRHLQGREACCLSGNHFSRHNWRWHDIHPTGTSQQSGGHPGRCH